MGERGVGNPWTTYEDNLLIQAVAIHGENDNWKAVASLVPGRTNKACRKRWLHSLSPNVKKTAWTQEEDQLLLSLYATHGTKWSIIARNIPGRTDDACSKRYREALDPSLKRDDWTGEEDCKLLDAYRRLGGKWGLIGQELNRSGLGCRNRWRMLERRRVATSRDHAGPSEPASTVSGSSSTPPHWTPAHVPEASFWDGRSPQYVAPSALYQGSPPHVQEPHATSFSPEQILSGAHLLGQPSRPRSPVPFQYTSSSLSAALSHPSSVTHSPNPHGYDPSEAYSPRHGPSELSATNAPSSDTRPGAYGARDYEYLGHDANALPGPYQHASGHTATRISSVNDFAGNSSSAQSAPDYAEGQDPPGPTIIFVTAGYDRVRSSLHVSEPRQFIVVICRTSSSPSVLAYACGHHDCWLEGAMTSRNAYVTSKELSDHSKTDHGGDLGGSRPFRCGLTGCEKSWKGHPPVLFAALTRIAQSINGLQYHLQISKYHFQQALATRTDNPDHGGSAAPDTPSTEREAGGNEMATSGAVEPPHGTVCTEAEDAEPSRTPPALVPQRTPDKTGPGTVPVSEKPKRKLHVCPHPGCSKEYKQLSGLRYHLTHGHTDALPLQLEVVPPTLARMVAQKECSTRR
nr:R2R3-Myb transcription factor [Ganoderma lucidum]